jgi:hypothetical protein
MVKMTPLFGYCGLRDEHYTMPPDSTAEDEMLTETITTWWMDKSGQ